MRLASSAVEAALLPEGLDIPYQRSRRLVLPRFRQHGPIRAAGPVARTQRRLSSLNDVEDQQTSRWQDLRRALEELPHKGVRDFRLFVVSQRLADRQHSLARGDLRLVNRRVNEGC